MRSGMLSQLPVSLPEAVTSRTAWNKPGCNVAVRRRSSSQSNVVTTDYGWIDSVDGDESDKENGFAEMGEPEHGDRYVGACSQSCGESCEVDVVSPWKSPDSSFSMDVDMDDKYVITKSYDVLERPPHAGRPTQRPRCPEGLLAMPQVGRRRLPLGTIDEATEPSTTKSTANSSESSSLSGAKDMEQESDAVRPEAEMTTADSFYEPTSRWSTSVTTANSDDNVVGSRRMDGDEADNITDVSVRQRCAGWRFSSSRPRLTVTEFCRRRRDTEARKRQRSTSETDDRMSMNSSVVSFGPSTKRRKTSLKVMHTGSVSEARLDSAYGCFTRKVTLMSPTGVTGGDACGRRGYY